MVVLRQFLYRDDKLILQFLAQMEGGTYDEEHITEHSESSGGFAGAIGGGPAKVSADRKKHGSQAAARTVRQTEESRFNRLHLLLEENDAIQPLAAMDDEIWNQLEPSEIVEVTADLTLAPGVAEIENASRVGQLSPMLDLVRDLPPSLRPANYDERQVEQVRAQLPVVAGVAAQFSDVDIPCTFAPVGTPKYKFFSELPRAYLVGSVGDLEGEVTVLAQVQRFVAKAKPETLGPGIVPVKLSREQRRKQKSVQPLTVRLSHPAAVVTTLAVYR